MRDTNMNWQSQSYHFCTDRFAQRERFDAYRGEPLGRYSTCEATRIPGDESPFFMRVTGHSLGAIEYSCYEGSSAVVSRKNYHLGDDNDNYLFRINQAGTMHFMQSTPMRGKTRYEEKKVCPSGVLVSNGYASEAVFGQGSHGYRKILTFAFSRKALQSSADGARTSLPHYASYSGPLLKALIRCAEELTTGQLSPEFTSAQSVGEYMLDLITMASAPKLASRSLARGGSRNIRRARLAIILDFIKHSFRSNDLKVLHVARYLGTTERYVQQLLEETSTTFTQLVSESRLELVSNMLLNPTMQSIPISAIAAECGFNDLSHFNEVFKRRFARTPREHRNTQSGVEAL